MFKGRYSSRELLVSGVEWNCMAWMSCGHMKRPTSSPLDSIEIYFLGTLPYHRGPSSLPGIHRPTNEIPTTPWPSSSWSSFSRGLEISFLSPGGWMARGSGWEDWRLRRHNRRGVRDVASPFFYPGRTGIVVCRSLP